LADQDQNPGRKWREVERDGDGNKYFDHFRFTPYTTDLEFYRDPNIYETEDVPRTTQDRNLKSEDDTGRTARGEQRPDARSEAEIKELLAKVHGLDADDIHVDVKDGIVTLSGTVHSPNEKETAGRVAEDVFAVAGVNNNLEIDKQQE